MARALLAVLLALATGSPRAQAPSRPADLVALAASASPAVTPATDAPLRVRTPGPDTLLVAPGGTVGFGIRIDETSGRSRAVHLDATPLGGWRTLITRPTLDLTARGSTLQLVSLRAPMDAEAGFYPIDVWVRADGHTPTRVRKVVEVSVREAIAVMVTGGPRYVPAGEPYSATVLVSNGGNAPALVALALRSTERHAVDPAETAVEVPPATTVEVPVVVQTAVRPTATTDRLLVEARLSGRPGLAARGQTTVEVIPRTGSAAPDHTWPLVGAISAVGRDGASVPLVGLAGRVPLDPAGRHQASLVLAGIGQRSESVYAGTPEWWAEYRGPGVEARAGTGSYMLSPATASSTYGAGARVQLEHRGVIAAAHVRQPLTRTAQVPNTDVGATVGARGRLGEATLNALMGVGELGGRVVTARVQSEALPRLDLDTEAGLALDRMRPVYSLRASADVGRLALGATARRRDQSQPGRFTSHTAHTLQGRMALAPRSFIRVSWRAASQDAGRGDILRPSSEDLLDAMVEGTTDLGGVTLTGGLGAAREHRVRLGLFDRTQTAARGQLGLAWRGARLRLDGDLGRVTFADADGATPGWTARLSTGYNGSWGHVSGHVEGAEGGSMWDTYASRRWLGGVSGAVRLGEWLRLQAGLDVGEYRVDTPEQALRDATASGRLDATVQLPADRELSLGASVYRAGDYRADHAHLTLRVPVRVPLPYRAEVARVRGRFVDAGTGRGVSGLVVFFGSDRVVTDRDGAFSFDATPAGGYLFVDRSTLGADQVPLTALPLQLRPGEPVEIEIGRRVSIRGALRRVRVLGTGARTDTTDAAGVPHVVVEAEGTGQRHRVVTDAEGRFDFLDLPAGVYTLRVVHGRMPEGHRLERETWPLHVTEPVDLLWRVVPERREIRILRGGTIRAEAAPASRPLLTVRPQPADPVAAASAPSSSEPGARSDAGASPVAARLSVREQPEGPTPQPIAPPPAHSVDADSAQGARPQVLTERASVVTAEAGLPVPAEGATRRSRDGAFRTVGASAPPSARRRKAAGLPGRSSSVSKGSPVRVLAPAIVGRGLHCLAGGPEWPGAPASARDARLAKARSPVPAADGTDCARMSRSPFRMPAPVQQPVVSCRATRRRTTPGEASLET
ncbi:carboxypeptidase regulatory-like domain-containing protein [Rubrivirga marina]|uniref:Alpha-galactosidase NEW3 domain-containing protein n=1 Tax=Rubrivirga marina TaxID=1196024 RepID=A0A271J171_9BACT|nr:carboxypeptidase regulatory-like domain-containing protein [Rubrivirga marina]PAP76784.1 hypothetical protein BSZ37_10230 [Rubrivirga marina]